MSDCGASLVVRSLMVPLLFHKLPVQPSRAPGRPGKGTAGASAYATNSRCCRARGICARGMNIGPASRLRSRQNFDRLGRSISLGPVSFTDALLRPVRREQESGDDYGEEKSGSARRRRSSAFAHLSSLTATKVYSASNNADSLCRVTDGAPGRGGKGSGTALIAGLEERGRTDSVKPLHRGGDCAGTEYLWRCRPCCACALRRLGDRGGYRTGPGAHGPAGSRDACRPLTDAASPGEALAAVHGNKVAYREFGKYGTGLSRSRTAVRSVALARAAGLDGSDLHCASCRMGCRQHRRRLRPATERRPPDRRLATLRFEPRGFQERLGLQPGRDLAGRWDACQWALLPCPRRRRFSTTNVAISASAGTAMSNPKKMSATGSLPGPIGGDRIGRGQAVLWLMPPCGGTG